MSRRWMPIAICSLVALDAGSGVRCLSAEEKVAEKIIAQEPIAPAASEGQADLDAALQEKVSVEDLRGLNHVIELLESALDKGLDVENSDFAESLLSGSRLERAAQLHNVLKRVPSDQLSDPRMSEVRRMAISDLRFVLTFDGMGVRLASTSVSEMPSTLMKIDCPMIG